MSVLIKGIEIPKNCESCPCKTADAFGGLGCQPTGYIPLRKANQDRPDWCPLGHIPTHGRLIDADEFIIRINDLVQKAKADEFYLGVAWYTAFIRHIEIAPTIIPAEETTNKDGGPDDA